MLLYYYVIILFWCYNVDISLFRDYLGETLAASQDSEWQWVHPMSSGPDNCLHGSWKVGWLCLGETGIEVMSLFQWLKSWKNHEKPSSSSRSCLRLRCLRCRILQDEQWELCPMSWGNDLPCGERSLVNQAKGLLSGHFRRCVSSDSMMIQPFCWKNPWSKDIGNYYNPNISYSVFLFSLVAKPLSLQVVLSGWKHPVVSSMILLWFKISFTFVGNR